MNNIGYIFIKLTRTIIRKRYFLYFSLISIMLTSLMGSNRSFNKVDRPFTHRVSMKNNLNAWEYLDLRQKIAQLIMVRIRTDFYNSESSYKKQLKKWISEDGVGGVILFHGNGNIHGIYHNIQEFQSWAKTPLIVGSDLERGLAQQVGAGATSFPHPMAVAATGDTLLSYKQG